MLRTVAVHMYVDLENLLRAREGKSFEAWTKGVRPERAVFHVSFDPKRIVGYEVLDGGYRVDVEGVNWQVIRNG